jgi:hypothetical protein
MILHGGALSSLQRRRSESQPSSRTGENPPYGMIGGIEETSASFEARSAPRSYPTPILPVIGGRRTAHCALVLQPRSKPLSISAWK